MEKQDEKDLTGSLPFFADTAFDEWLTQTDNPYDRYFLNWWVSRKIDQTDKTICFHPKCKSPAVQQCSHPKHACEFFWCEQHQVHKHYACNYTRQCRENKPIANGYSLDETNVMDFGYWLICQECQNRILERNIQAKKEIAEIDRLNALRYLLAKKEGPKPVSIQEQKSPRQCDVCHGTVNVSSGKSPLCRACLIRLKIV